MTRSSASTTISIGQFDLAGMLQCSNLVQRAAHAAGSLDEAGARVARCLYDSFVVPDTGDHACALVRVFVTRDVAALAPAQRSFLDRRLRPGTTLTPTTKCLVLLGTAGAESAWNDPARSAQHFVIPLASEDVVRAAPMIAGLIEQFGLAISDVLRPPLALAPELRDKGYNVFHVEHARGSAYIPSQDEFVIPYGIASVIGWGGRLRSGDLFAAILFSRVHIPPSSAERFRSVALRLRSALFVLEEGATAS